MTRHLVIVSFYALGFVLVIALPKTNNNAIQIGQFESDNNAVALIAKDKDHLPEINNNLLSNASESQIVENAGDHFRQNGNGTVDDEVFAVFYEMGIGEELTKTEGLQQARRKRSEPSGSARPPPPPQHPSRTQPGEATLQPTRKGWGQSTKKTLKGWWNSLQGLFGGNRS